MKWTRGAHVEYYSTNRLETPTGLLEYVKTRVDAGEKEKTDTVKKSVLIVQVHRPLRSANL